MTIQEKLQIIADALGTETTNVQPGVLLEDIEEWDSMGVISVISMLDKMFGVNLNMNEIAALRSVDDILEYMKEQ
mgnify:CR=1 FL=1